MRGTHTNTITVESGSRYPYRNAFRVTVLGFDGKGEFVRDSLSSAVFTAGKYAELFDAPKNIQYI